MDPESSLLGDDAWSAAGGTSRSGVSFRRRDLFAGAALPIAWAGLPRLAFAHQVDAAPAIRTARPDRVDFPRQFRGQALSRISMPLGGIGTGGIGLGGRGNLQDWEIYNRPDRGRVPKFAFAAAWVKKGVGQPQSVIVERRYLPPYDTGYQALGANNVPALPRLREARFTAAFPIARVDFEDDGLRVQFSLEAYAPFAPGEADAAGLPAFYLDYHVHNPGPEPAEVALCYVLDNPVGAGAGRRNALKDVDGAAGFLMSNTALAPADPEWGSVAIAAFGDGAEVERTTRWPGTDEWNDGPQTFWFDRFGKTGRLGDDPAEGLPVASVALRRVVAPRSTALFRFVIAWHFPNRTPSRCGWQALDGKADTVIGNHYATRFADAWAVIDHAVANRAALEADTRGFVDRVIASTLPGAVRDAAMSNLSTLVSNTCFRTADGRFEGFEGCGDNKGLGYGTCTHVWNYELATHALFPALARSMRETSFCEATDGEGHMAFRHRLPEGRDEKGAAAADGQMGQIVRLYMDWRQSGDTAWLRRCWPGAERALRFAWIAGGWDADRDGVMEGAQHNTYDIEFFGPNPQAATWYLAALRCAAVMARALGDARFADDCDRLATRGSARIDAALFNGDYYVQHVRGMPGTAIAPRLLAGVGGADTVNPAYQVGDGCLIDQLVGQIMAGHAGLPALLDPARIGKAMQAIYRHNRETELGRHPSVQRAFAVNDDAGLVICSFPRGGRPVQPMPYYAEVMSGFEYTAAAGMAQAGMIDEAATCVEDVRLRFDGEKGNPFDEIEWGRHYARAMASWGMVPALSGWHYDAIEQRLRIDPRIDRADFRCFWSAAGCWGDFSHVEQAQARMLVVNAVKGDLPVRRIELAWPMAGSVQVRIGGADAPHIVRQSHAIMRIELAATARIAVGRGLRVTVPS